MKKKLFILLLASVLITSSCGNSSSTSDVSNDTETSNVVNESVESTDAENAKSEEVEDHHAALDFEEITVVDNEECTIKITGINSESIWGYTLNAYLENKSPDKTYMFSIKNAAINSVQYDPLFATEVAAGKKSNGDINFTVKDDIGDFTDIEMTFRVYDSNDWMADAVAEETTHIYPYGEGNVAIFERSPQSNDNTIIDNDYVSVIVTGYEHDDIWGYTVNLFLVNKSDKEIMFSVDDASVNGYMADPFYATSVMPGKCSFSSMSWSDSILEENSISEIEEIEFSFRAYDSNEFTSEDFANEVITLNP